VKAARPPVGGAAGFLVLLTAIYVFDRTTHLDVIAAAVFVLSCLAVIGWFFWSRRYQ
jgi:hypothetical protein